MPFRRLLRISISAMGSVGVPLRGMHLDVGAHLEQKLQQTGTGWVHADVTQKQRLFRRGETSGDHEEGRRGEIRGHLDLRAFELLAALDRDRRAVRTDLDAERAKHPFRVIARGRRLGDPRNALRLKAGEDHRRFHLGAGDGQFVVDALQLRALDLHRRTSILGRDVGAHQPQRHRRALHGTAHQRLIANQCRFETLRGQQSHGKTHGRAGISHIQGLGGGLQAVKPNTVNNHVLLFRALDANTHRLQGTQGRQTILAREEARDVGNTLGNSSQHQGAMRDGFVTGDCQLALGNTARAGQIFRHNYCTARG